jgi:hypothetical protein
MSRHMLEYFTLERTIEFLEKCVREGINTWQASYNDAMARQFPEIRDAGCRIQFICLAARGISTQTCRAPPEAVVQGERRGTSAR